MHGPPDSKGAGRWRGPAASLVVQEKNAADGQMWLCMMGTSTGVTGLLVMGRDLWELLDDLDERLMHFQ